MLIWKLLVYLAQKQTVDIFSTLFKIFKTFVKMVTFMLSKFKKRIKVFLSRNMYTYARNNSDFLSEESPKVHLCTEQSVHRCPPSGHHM